MRMAAHRLRASRHRPGDVGIRLRGPRSEPLPHTAARRASDDRIRRRRAHAHARHGRHRGRAGRYRSADRSSPALDQRGRPGPVRHGSPRLPERRRHRLPHVRDPAGCGHRLEDHGLGRVRDRLQSLLGPGNGRRRHHRRHAPGGRHGLERDQSHRGRSGQTLPDLRARARGTHGAGRPTVHHLRAQRLHRRPAVGGQPQ